MKSLEQFKEWFKGISFPVYFCCILLGLSAWIDFSGVWVQMPIMVNELPEGWNLPSYLMTIMQVGQLGPIAFLIANRCAPTKVKEWPVIFLIIGLGGVCCLLLAFLWQETSYLAGELHSTALFFLCASLALVDATSSVVYLGYMSFFKPQYMTAYYIGDGLSGLIPGLVGFGQGLGFDPSCVNTSSVFHNETTGENITTWRVIPVNREPTFSSKYFFLFLFAMLVVSFVGFAVLHFSPFAKKQHLPNADESPEATEKSGIPKHDELEDISTISHKELDKAAQSAPRDADGRDLTKAALTNLQLAGIISMNFWILFLSIGCFKGLESYATLPYGNRAYGLTVRLGKIADPFACFLSLLIPKISVVKMVVLTCIGTVLFSYLLALAIMSPFPPLVDEPIGEVLAVGSAIIMICVFTYTRICAVIFLQSRAGRRGILINGAIDQLGVFFGTIIVFLVINVFHLLTRAPPC